MSGGEAAAWGIRDLAWRGLTRLSGDLPAGMISLAGDQGLIPRGSEMPVPRCWARLPVRGAQAGPGCRRRRAPGIGRSH